MTLTLTLTLALLDQGGTNTNPNPDPDPDPDPNPSTNPNLTKANWVLLKTANCSNALRSQLRRNFGKLYASQGRHAVVSSKQ
eukprot:scaffold45284_cov63-Phaeocystis_antarctica.AAC.1